MLQSLTSPGCELRLWSLVSFLASSPPTFVTLKECSVDRPCDKEGNWFVIVHSDDRYISRNALASGSTKRPFVIERQPGANARRLISPCDEMQSAATR